ncbi:unnamed protein product, partial [Arabidopsis halleri]
NRLSLIARPLNQHSQSLHAVVSSLPRSWGLESRVHGRVIDDTFIQFRFQSEIDLVYVQRREPWLFNNWFVAFQRWEDYPDRDYLTTIDLWVQIRGIPLAYVSEGTVRYIAQHLGEIVYLDFDEATTTHINFIRVRIRFEITASLRFFRRIRFQYGERATVSFQYERLPPVPSLSSEIPEVPVYHGPANDDEICRSDRNSQSQMSDNSFPAPFPPPPRSVSPPINVDELAAASPYFPGIHLRGLNHFAAPIPSRRRQSSTVSSSTFSSSTASNPTPHSPPSHEAFVSNYPRCFEIGECSKRKNTYDKNQKPPKKR